MTLKTFLLIFLIFAGATARAENGSAFSLSFGPMVIGEERIPIDLTEFPVFIKREMNSNITVESNWIEDSVQWVRLNNNMLLPRARLHLRVGAAAGRVSIHYLDRVLSLQEFGEGREISAHTELYFSLFHPENLSVYIDGKLLATLTLHPTLHSVAERSRLLIDYSCAPFNVEIKGLEGDFVSASCQLVRIGKMGSEEPMLEVYWTAVQAKMLDGSTPPFTAVFRDSNTVKTTLKNWNNEVKIVEINAKLPKRLPRLKIAAGLGPYKFNSDRSNADKTSEFAPSATLYGNFYLTDELSVRGFDAAVSQSPATKAFFNNFGVYFAYELGKAFDRRFQAVALLGFQGITFAHNGLNGDSFSQAILPQGFEVTYLHAFGIKNSILGYGMFILPSKDNPYRNVWLRFGKKVFGEVNYITWNKAEMHAAMWGVSLGMPLASFF